MQEVRNMLSGTSFVLPIIFFCFLYLTLLSEISHFLKATRRISQRGIVEQSESDSIFAKRIKGSKFLCRAMWDFLHACQSLKIRSESVGRPAFARCNLAAELREWALRLKHDMEFGIS